MIALSAISLFGWITVICGQACPPGQTPFMPPPANTAIACNQATPNSCPPNVFCQSVPSNGAQFPNLVTLCCLNLTPANCPAPQVPYLLPPTSTPVPCTVGAPNNCPEPSICVNVPANAAGIQNLCCAAADAVFTTTTTTTTTTTAATTTTVAGATTTIAGATTTIGGGGINPGPGGTLSAARCSDPTERPLFETGTTYYRNCLYKVCPSTHDCEYDYTNKVYTCCGPPASTSASDCAVSNILMYPQTGSPVVCPTAGSTTSCPTSNKYCMYSASFGYNVCCSTSTTTTTTSSTECPSGGVYMYPASANFPSSPLVCTQVGSTTQCPTANKYCIYSASYGYNVCCSTNPTSTTTSSTECPSTGVYMYPASANFPSSPLVCTQVGSTTQCPTANKYCIYSASYGYNICCSTNPSSTTTGTTTSSTDCPSTGVYMYPASANFPASPLVCTQVGSTTQCPTANKYCIYSASYGYNVCCSTNPTSTTSTTTSSTECPSTGVYMYPASANFPSSPLVCTQVGSTTQCPTANKYCVYSASYGYNICCSTSTSTTTGK